MSSEEKVRPLLSEVALVSFIVSFIVARTFTILNPNLQLISGDFHIHHFWYGLILLAISGWLGISYRSERIDRLAAILYGIGGGLIGDEIGLLLTFQNYWTEITYTFILIFITFISMLILFNNYSKVIYIEFTKLSRSIIGLYFGIFILVVSTAFIVETDNMVITISSSLLAITGCVIILAYFIQVYIRRTELTKK